MTTPDEALHELARKAALADDIERELAGGKSFIAYLLSTARDDCARALVGLLTVDPADAVAVRKWQSEALRYRDIAWWIRDAVAQGESAYRQLTAAEHEELLDIIAPRDPAVPQNEDV